MPADRSSAAADHCVASVAPVVLLDMTIADTSNCRGDVAMAD